MLLVTADGALARRLLDLVSSAGAQPVQLANLAEAAARRREWDAATLVLVGADVAGTIDAVPLDPDGLDPDRLDPDRLDPDRLDPRRGAPGPPRRGGVVLVADGPPPAQVWQQAVALGAEHVAVLPAAQGWLLERVLDATSAPASAPVIAVVGGRGGAGASTLATALAVVAAGSAVTTTLLDADPLGGGLDLLLGVEDDAGLRWGDLAGARGRLQPGLLATALPGAEGVRVLSWGRTGPLRLPPEAMASVLDASCRESGLVVVDLPRRLDEAADVAVRHSRLVLVVVPAEVRATAAAARLVGALEPHARDVRLVVRGPAPTGLAAQDVADALELPLAGELRAEPGLAAALDRGEPPPSRQRGPLASLCRRVVAEVLA